MPQSRDKTPAPTPSLPHARAPIDATAEPIVGNETVDDNLVECVQIALWNALGDFHRSVTPGVKDRVVTLSGTLPSRAHHDRATAAARKIAGVQDVLSEVIVAGESELAPPAPRKKAKARLSVTHMTAEPCVYLVRYCSLDEASLSAAVRQGIDELDAFLEAAGKPPAERLFLVYRNRLPATVTLEIGVPVDSATAKLATGDLHAGTSPAGAFVSREIGAGMPALLAAEDELKHLAAQGGVRARPYFWQRFEKANFRPWQGHPPGPIHLPVEPSPGKSGPATASKTRR